MNNKEDFEKIDINKSEFIPKGDTCNGCSHCTIKLKQYVNMFGDETSIREVPYCDLFNEELFENGEIYCCNKSYKKCFSCKIRVNKDVIAKESLFLLACFYYVCQCDDKELIKWLGSDANDNE